MKDIQAQLPVGMKAGIPYDSTLYIQNAIHEVLKTLTETLLIVILVIFLFLQSWRSTIVPAITIPVSLVGTFAFIKLFGFSINERALRSTTCSTAANAVLLTASACPELG